LEYLLPDETLHRRQSPIEMDANTFREAGHALKIAELRVNVQKMDRAFRDSLRDKKTVLREYNENYGQVMGHADTYAGRLCL